MYRRQGLVDSQQQHSENKNKLISYNTIVIHVAVVVQGQLDIHMEKVELWNEIMVTNWLLLLLVYLNRTMYYNNIITDNIHMYIMGNQGNEFRSYTHTHTHVICYS